MDSDEVLKEYDVVVLGTGEFTSLNQSQWFDNDAQD